MDQRITYTLTAGLVAAFAAGLALPEASACGNAVMLRKNEAARLVAKAEKALDAGKFQRTLALLEYGEIMTPDRHLQKRIGVLTGTARLRRGETTDAAWTFDGLHSAYPKDTLIQTRLGETLSRLPRRAAKKKALSILDELATKDLMADEFGYAALARLRDANGDTEGRDQALSRCKAMAKDSAICALAPTKKAKPKKKTKPEKKAKPEKKSKKQKPSKGIS